MSHFIKAGKIVLIPIGDNERYDFVIDEDGRFRRIQVKTGKVKNGAIEFSTASTNLENGKWVRHGYRGQIDDFAVYCPKLDKVYLVPIDEAGGQTHCSLRLEPAKNGNKMALGWLSSTRFRATN